MKTSVHFEPVQRWNMNAQNQKIAVEWKKEVSYQVPIDGTQE